MAWGVAGGSKSFIRAFLLLEFCLRIEGEVKGVLGSEAIFKMESAGLYDV
jgi:hypothetical protein